MDPRVARFMARHHRPLREEVEAEVAPYRGRSPEETWPDVVAVCRGAARLLSWNPERDQVMAEVDPTYREIIRRLRQARTR